MTDCFNSKLMLEESISIIAEMGAHLLKCKRCQQLYCDILNHGKVPYPSFLANRSGEKL